VSAGIRLVCSSGVLDGPACKCISGVECWMDEFIVVNVFQWFYADQVTAVVCGASHTLALTSEGLVYLWGTFRFDSIICATWVYVYVYVHIFVFSVRLHSTSFHLCIQSP
jgi:hypothetical protein